MLKGVLFSGVKIYLGLTERNDIPYSGNFSQGANFCRFADRLVSAKIQTMGVVTSCKKVSHVLELRLIKGTKIKNTNISSEVLRGDSTKICTHENAPRYTVTVSEICMNLNINFGT